ncbi:hypothetical protein SFUMM280S_03479 [Streptomyces fumanus]
MAEDLDLPTPPVLENEDGQRGETVLIPPTPAQRRFIEELPHKPWVRKPGGVLKALGEGLRASVDLDLVDATEALHNLGLNITADQISSEDPAGGGRVLDMEKVADLADAAAVDMRSVGGSKEMGSKIPYAAERSRRSGGDEGHRLPGLGGRPDPAGTARRPPACFPGRRHPRQHRPLRRRPVRGPARRTGAAGDAARVHPLHPRGGHRPQEGAVVRRLPLRTRPRFGRKHAENGNRDQHPGQGGRAAPPVLPVAAGGHGPA